MGVRVIVLDAWSRFRRLAFLTNALCLSQATSNNRADRDCKMQGAVLLFGGMPSCEPDDA
jgi:hypothetical protein